MILCTIMTSAIKGIVSKNKIRYKEGGFDLDLSYISKNIIAMGFPAETLERFYRNHIDDVVRFFDRRHPNRYKIYNLCSESKRRYDVSKFNGPVDEEYSFQDHNPPPFAILKPFCESVHMWLKSDADNVAGIHCKAGKGRTGVMVCAYLVHAGGCQRENGDYVTIPDADTALDYYGRHRTHDLKGVTIPSQKRYVYYYEELVKRNLEYRLLPLKFNSITFTSVPIFNSGTYTLTCEIYQIPKQKIKSFDIEIKKGSKRIMYKLDDQLCLTGDLKFEFYVRKIKKEKVLQFCLNTFFVSHGVDSIVFEPCDQCMARDALVEGMAVKSLHPSSVKNRSVIDSSFLGLIDGCRNENFRFCDCQLSPNAIDLSLHSNSTASHSASEIGQSLAISSASSPHPSTISSLNRDNKLSLSSSASSSSSSHSLNHKMSDSDPQLCKRTPKREMLVVLPKDQLDKAHKDKSNKIFTSDFKVLLSFSSLDYEQGATMKTDVKLADDCCIDYDPSSTDSENYSEDEDDTNSDTESHQLSDRKSTLLPSFAVVTGGQKKARETTHL